MSKAQENLFKATSTQYSGYGRWVGLSRYTLDIPHYTQSDSLGDDTFIARSDVRTYFNPLITALERGETSQEGTLLRGLLSSSRDISDFIKTCEAERPHINIDGKSYVKFYNYNQLSSTIEILAALKHHLSFDSEKMTEVEKEFWSGKLDFIKDSPSLADTFKLTARSRKPQQQPTPEIE